MSNDNTRGQKVPDRRPELESFQNARRFWIQRKDSVERWMAAEPADVADLEAMR
jgi:hypothetical protein